MEKRPRVKPQSLTGNPDPAETQRLTALLEAAAKASTYDSNPKLWDELLSALNLDICYQLTIADVLRQGRWRQAKNPRAYIASAAVRSARRKKLPDYSEKEFRRVASGDVNGDVGNRIDSAAGFDIEEWGGGGVYERTAYGAIRYVDSDDYDLNQIPVWLQRGNEYDAIDWETVAAYAALKPRMACQLARVLIMRQLGIGRPEAVSRAESAKEDAKAIEAAWKWIDRNFDERIAPLFKMADPPRSLVAEDIASFPLLAPGVSLRVDLQQHWQGKTLFCIRTGVLPDGDGAFPVWCIEANSEAAAMDKLRLEAAGADAEEDSDIFHLWPIEPEAGVTEKSKASTPKTFAKPWEVLARVGAKNSRPF